MALASATVIAMEGDSVGIHPFFTGARDQSHDPSPIGHAEARNASIQQRAGEPDDGFKKTRKHRKAASEQGTLQSTLNFGQRRVEEIPKARPTNGQTLEIEGLALPTATGQDETASFEQANDSSTPGLPIPGLQSRVKAPYIGEGGRHGTDFTERPGTPLHVEGHNTLDWEGQLLQAGFGESSPTEEKIKTRPSIPVPAMSVRKIEPQNAASVPAEGTKELTTPKKIIKLRTDGKLVSPKATETGIKKSRRKRKSAEVTTDLGKAVVISYRHGKTDRMVIGQQIEEIINGKTRISESPAIHKTLSTRVSPEQPAKPTHPFFTGKIARMKIASQALEDSDVTASSGERPKSPTKPSAPSKTSWAGFGLSFTKTQRSPGVVQAIWPPRDMVHCRGSIETSAGIRQQPVRISQRKMKGSQSRVNKDEDLMRVFQERLFSTNPDSIFQNKNIHHPTRQLLTGEELRNLVRHQLSIQDMKLGHPAISSLATEVQTSLSAFDKFECQSQEWIHRYAPRKLSQVLCKDKNLLLLGDWLAAQSVNAVNTGSTSSATEAAIGRKKSRARKRRRISDELNDFIVSSEDETNPDELSDPEDERGTPSHVIPRLTTRNMCRVRAVILNGPHGSGKTAAVYASAHELGFEVFEINSGTRRNGRDVLDRVGDMTRNHLVRQMPDDASAESSRQSPAPEASSEIESGRQSTMNSFFKAKQDSKTIGQQRQTIAKATLPPSQIQKPIRKQKQSLILLEEVDVLFEEDKQFWSTVLSLLLSSRRPVIMTCTDETQVPVEEMIDVAGLTFSPIPETLAVDYLLLLAANEGHLLPRSTVKTLFRLRGADLRASIMQLNFNCQMAIGDTKGGLEWMLIRSNPAESSTANGEPLRVVSQNTFTPPMTALMVHENEMQSNARSRLEEGANLVNDIHEAWSIHPEDWIWSGIDSDSLHGISLSELRRVEACTDALSAADILPGSGLLGCEKQWIDPSHPLLTGKERLNFPEGYHLLDATPHMDPSGMSQAIVNTLHVQSHSIRNSQQSSATISPSLFASILATRSPHLGALQRGSARALSSALDPLSLPNPTYLGTTSSSRLLATEMPILAGEIAPYVRSIVNSDLELEQQRLKLSNLMSEGGGGAKKKARTTRAARAALEGGRKESTRRERWFRKEVSYKLVQGTGTGEWEAAKARLVAQLTEEMAEQPGEASARFAVRTGCDAAEIIIDGKAVGIGDEMDLDSGDELAHM